MRNRYLFIADALAISVAACAAFGVRFGWLFLEFRPEFVPFLAGMACRDRGGHIANNMARRALRYSRDTGRRHYAKPLAEALLDENCQGAKALTDETRGRLENLVAATE